MLTEALKDWYHKVVGLCNLAEHHFAVGVPNATGNYSYYVILQELLACIC